MKKGFYLKVGEESRCELADGKNLRFFSNSAVIFARDSSENISQ